MIAAINASKEFVNLSVHLTFTSFAIVDVKRQLKLLEMACDQVQTCLIFPWDGQVFLLKLVEMLSGNTYFRCISIISRPFTLFLLL